jgi:ferredoxin
MPKRTKLWLTPAKLGAVSLDQYLSGKEVIGAPEPVNVLMGSLSEEELAVMLRNIEQSPRAAMPHLQMDKRRTTFEEVELGFSLDAATREARRCLGCGCGKAIPCRFRQLATEYGADPQRFAGQRRHFARDTSHPEIIFEPGKCILCGACVRVAAQAGEELGLALIGRGFQVAAAVPFDRPMAEALRKSARRAAEGLPHGRDHAQGRRLRRVPPCVEGKEEGRRSKEFSVTQEGDGAYVAECLSRCGRVRADSPNPPNLCAGRTLSYSFSNPPDRSGSPRRLRG